MFTQKTIRGWEQFIQIMEMSYGVPFELVKTSKRRLDFQIRATRSTLRLILWNISFIHMASNGFCAAVSFIRGIYFQDRKTFSLAIDFAYALTYFYVLLFHVTLLWKRDDIAALLNETIRYDRVLVKIFGPIQRSLKSDGVDVLLKACNPFNFVFPCGTVGLFFYSPYEPRYLLHYLPNSVKGLPAVVAFALVEYRIYAILVITIHFHMLLLVTYGRMSNHWVHFIA